nr:hypothetical protein [Calliblepharis sp.]
MIQYWPQYQSLELNKQVVSLFYNTRQKLSYDLSNQTNNSLYIDLLDSNNKKKLFSNVLIEMEMIILDIIALDLKLENIQLLSSKILCDLIYKSLKRFIPRSLYYCDNFFTNHSNYLKAVFTEHRLLIEYILIYLTHGTSKIVSHIFVFDNKNTPINHVYVLFENLIIQSSDLIIYIILNDMNSLFSVVTFIKKNQLSNNSYLSIRSLVLFLNTLVIQNSFRLYISQPKSIYDSRYKVWLLSSSGLITKYIHVSRLDDICLLSKLQMVIFFFMEVQDLIVPQVEKLILILSKIFLYILVNLLGNSAIFFIRFILVSVNSLHK